MSLIKRNGSGNTGTRLPVFTNLLESFFDDDFIKSFSFRGGLPAVNVKDSNNSYELEVVAPGFKKEDFKLNLDNNVLTISAEIEETKEDHDGYRRKEFLRSSFQRSFQLSENEVDFEKIDAKYEDGILKISIPKRDEAKNKQRKTINIS
jgi:HSP20 family protein